MSTGITRYLRNIQRTGIKDWVRQMWYIGDAKGGTLVGTDQFGNQYFENYNGEEETPGRHRWMTFSQDQYHASQVPPDWHSWIHHIRKDPPTHDSIIQQARPAWQQEWTENLTGTRGAYKPYNTCKPKISAWEPKPSSRG